MGGALDRGGGDVGSALKGTGPMREPPALPLGRCVWGDPIQTQRADFRAWGRAVVYRQLPPKVLPVINPALDTLFTQQAPP